MDSIVKLRHISKQYEIGEHKVNVLQDINMDVQRGDMLAITGTSGSGKTTLMNILGLLNHADNGQYWLEGKEVISYNDDELSAMRNQKIGFVFQSFYLLQRLTAVDNVGYPLRYRHMSKKDIHEQSMAILDKVGMADRATHRPNELSGGQQQRVAIARAFVGNPAIILADEPTGALDRVISKKVLDLFLQLNQEQQTTTILITHDPEVARQCKSRLAMKDGRFKQVL